MRKALSDAIYEIPDTRPDWPGPILHRTEARTAIRNSGLRSTLRQMLSVVLACSDGPVSPFVTHRTNIREIGAMGGWGMTTAEMALRQLWGVGWVQAMDAPHGFYLMLCPLPEAVDEEQVYNPGEGVSSATRERVFARDGYRCRACDGTEDLRVDHVRPRRYGGSNKMDNLQTLCNPCNSSKGARF